MTREQVQRRTIRTLMVTNALGYAGFIGIAAVAGLLASEILGSDSLAGLPGAASTLGTALAATPLALRSRRRGRRLGSSFGYLIGAGGAVLVFFAGQAGVFLLLVAAMAVLGVGNASNLQNRYAAADLADEDQRARSISLVVWVGTIGAVLGPPAAVWVNRLGIGAGLPAWVSPALLGAAGFGLAAAVVSIFLRPDPLAEAGGIDPSARVRTPWQGARRSWRAIWPNPQARLAITAMAFSQMAMVAVMTMTPLHMKDHGHAELSTLVVALHVLGMFGFSPLVGRTADRLGRVRTLVLGAGILGSGTVLCIVAGYAPGLIFAGLFLLGLGWSFALIAGSALLTESVDLEHRVGAQGLSDVMMSLLGAVAATGSGFVKTTLGFHWLANFGTVTAIFVFLAAARVFANGRRPAVTGQV